MGLESHHQRCHRCSKSSVTRLHTNTSASPTRAGACSALVGDAANRCFDTGQSVRIADLCHRFDPARVRLDVKPQRAAADQAFLIPSLWPAAPDSRFGRQTSYPGPVLPKKGRIGVARPAAPTSLMQSNGLTSVALPLPLLVIAIVFPGCPCGMQRDG